MSATPKTVLDVLDFQKLIPQIQEIGREPLPEGDPQVRVLQSAVLAYEESGGAGDAFMEKIAANRGLTFWPLAEPLETPGHVAAVHAYRHAYTVVGSDGSQIMPTQHEVLNCYLVNVGIAAIGYQNDNPTVLSSTPHLFHQMEDLYPVVGGRQIAVDESVVSLERSYLEFSTACSIALSCKQSLLSSGSPVMCMLDGSLIPWNLDRFPEAYREYHHSRWQVLLDECRAAGVPVIGYVSHSRSTEVVNALRVWICPYSSSRCQTFCGHLSEPDYPCSRIYPLSDRYLLAAKLPYHARGAVYCSRSKWSESMPAHNRICFSYLHTGSEVARLEFPRWVFDDSVVFSTALQMVLSQTEKGMGYPVALSEAHNQAVIRQGDRARFFALLSGHLVSLGVDRIGVSPKELRKRKGIV